MPITFVALSIFPYCLLAALLVNLIQKKVSKWNKKRFATLYFSCLFGAICVFALIFLRFRIPDFLFIGVLIAAVVVVIVKKQDFLPFRLFCSNCRKMLSIKQFVFYDTKLCDNCSKNDSISKE